MAGRIAYYGNIVTQGLVLNLDAAIKESYPGTGSIWRDISQNNLSGSLISGSFYTGSDYGNMVFDATSSFTPSGNTFNFRPSTTGELSMEMWVYPTGPFTRYLSEPPTTNLAGIFGQGYFGNSTGWGLGVTTISGIGNCFNFQVRNATTILQAGVTSENGYAVFTTGSWYHVVGTFTRNDFSRLYINGELKSSISTTPLNELTITPSINNAAIGRISSFYAGCRVAVAKLYNRPLSSTEITQNFNALRGRYGI